MAAKNPLSDLPGSINIPRPSAADIPEETQEKLCAWYEAHFTNEERAMEITFKIHEDDDRVWLVGRLACLVCGTDQYVEKLDRTGYGLDSRSNNWWFSFRLPDPGSKFPVVSLRYRNGEQGRMEALKTVILWLVGNPRIQ